MSIVVGVLSSLVASVIFLLGTRFLTPKISISDQISAYPRDDASRDTYRVKIINRRFRSASDVSVQFFVQHLASVHGGAIKVRTPIGAKFSSHTLVGRKLGDKEFDNARRIRINSEELERIMCEKKNASIVVEVYCRDSISGFGRVFKKEYALGIDAFRRASFKKGPTFEMIDYKGASAFPLREMLGKSRDNGEVESAQ